MSRTFLSGYDHNVPFTPPKNQKQRLTPARGKDGTQHISLRVVAYNGEF
jgi:hypothetical protein